MEKVFKLRNVGRIESVVIAILKLFYAPIVPIRNIFDMIERNGPKY